jgi:hypothetical protein
LNVALTKDSLIDCAGRFATLEGKLPMLNNPYFAAMVVKEPFGVVFAMALWYRDTASNLSMVYILLTT